MSDKKKKKVGKAKKEKKKNSKREKTRRDKSVSVLKDQKTNERKKFKSDANDKSSSEKKNVKKLNVNHNNKTQKEISVGKGKSRGEQNFKIQKNTTSSTSKRKKVSSDIEITSANKKVSNDVYKIANKTVKTEKSKEKNQKKIKQKPDPSAASETTSKKKGKNWEEKFGFKDVQQVDASDYKKSPAVVFETPKREKDFIPKEKISDITSQVTSPGFSTSFTEIKKGKEPEGKFEMEFLVKCSPDLLFEFLYTPSGLAEWFCDDVNIRNGVYTFNWNGEIAQARLLKMNEGERVRYQWVNRTDGAYFEFRIVKDELTGDVSLFITDFADPPWDIEGNKLLWKKQIEKLLKLIGSLY